MSPDQSPYMYWRGFILSLKSATEAERRYAEGILDALDMIAHDPELASLTTDQTAELERTRSRKTRTAPR